MATQIFTVPVGTPQLFRPNGLPYNFCAQPSGGGTVLIDFSIDNGFSYIPSVPGAIATPYSFNNYSSLPAVGGPGLAAGQSAAIQGQIVRCTAATGAGQFICSDLSVPYNFGAEKNVLISEAVAYTMPTTTSEQTLFSARFHPGFFKSNFRLQIEAWFTCVLNAHVATVKEYFGPSAYASATGLEGGTVYFSQALTGFVGASIQTGVAGRNDNQTIVTTNTGLAAGGGQGSSATAQVVITSANYAGPNAVEQVLSITGTKATGTDTLTLDYVAVRMLQ